jgi:hypothetical protein
VGDLCCGFILDELLRFSFGKKVAKIPKLMKIALGDIHRINGRIIIKTELSSCSLLAVALFFGSCFTASGWLWRWLWLWLWLSGSVSARLCSL